MLPRQGAQVWSLVEELDPTYYNRPGSAKLKIHMYFFFFKATVLFEVFCRKVAKGDETVLRQGVRES